MTTNLFASLGSSTFDTLVRARQAHAAALAAEGAAEDLCVCTGRGRCRCAAAESIRAAERATEVASARRAEREAAWGEFCALRYGAA